MSRDTPMASLGPEASERLVDRVPPVESVCAAEDTWQQFLATLRPEKRRVAEWLRAGWSIRDIALKLNVPERLLGELITRMTGRFDLPGAAPR